MINELYGERLNVQCLIVIYYTVKLTLNIYADILVEVVVVNHL